MAFRSVSNLKKLAIAGGALAVSAGAALAWDTPAYWSGSVFQTGVALNTSFTAAVRGYDFSTSAIDANNKPVQITAYFYTKLNPGLGVDAPFRVVSFNAGAPARYSEPNRIAKGGSAPLGALGIVIASPAGIVIQSGTNVVDVNFDGQ